MANMASHVTTFLNSYEETTPDFHCPPVHSPILFVDISIGTFVHIKLDKKDRDGLVVGSCNSVSEVPADERDAVYHISEENGCGWVKVILMQKASDPAIACCEKFVPLRMPDVMNITECVLTLEYAWVRSDAIQDFLWVFRPESTNARLVDGMTNGRVIRYKLYKSDSTVLLLEDGTCLAFPSMYSEYQSMYVDCYVTRVFDTIVNIRRRIATILNRRAQTQGSEFCVNRNMPAMQMSVDTWAYISMRMLKSGIPKLEDYGSKRFIGDLRCHDLSFHTIRLHLEWEHFRIDCHSDLCKLQGILGSHIWVGTRKKRPKVDQAPNTIGINDAWNVVVPRPASVVSAEVEEFIDSTTLFEEDGTPTQVRMKYGKYDMLFDRTTRSFKIWIEYRKIGTLKDTRIKDILTSNQMPATATAFRDNWETDVIVNVGMTLMYTNSRGSYYLEIIGANDSEVQCTVLQAKDDCCPVGTQINISDVDKVRSIIKSKLQKTVNS